MMIFNDLREVPRFWAEKDEIAPSILMGRRAAATAPEPQLA